MSKSSWITGSALVFSLCFSMRAQQPAIAILDSQTARNYFGLHYADCRLETPPTTSALGSAEFERYLDGWTWVLDNYGASYSVITDADVVSGGLAPFTLLILPNEPNLSDEETKAIKSWVLKGGRLIATFGTGYKDVIADPRQTDQLKLQEGGSDGLHDLWHDPLSKMVSTQVLGFPAEYVPYIWLTQRGVAPTAGLSGLTGPAGDLLPYGSLANMLIQRPAGGKDVYGILVFDPPVWARPQPAILLDSAAKGQVMYLAFSPEYRVAMERGLPSVCQDSDRLPQGSSAPLASLMVSAVQFMLLQ